MASESLAIPSEPIQFPGGTGLFGGTFNPVHCGHLFAARAVCDALGLARMLLLPAAEPPLKSNAEETLAPAATRLHWVELAVASAGDPRLEACGIELERPGPSYTVDTLRLLRERLRGPLLFTIGEDAFAELPAWREPEVMLTLCHFAVLNRPPVADANSNPDPDRSPLTEWMPAEFASDFEFTPDRRAARHRRAGTWVQRLEVATLDISATRVRKKLRAGDATRGLLPEAVAKAAQQSGCYAPAASLRDKPIDKNDGDDGDH